MKHVIAFYQLTLLSVFLVGLIIGIAVGCKLKLPQEESCCPKKRRKNRQRI